MDSPPPGIYHERQQLSRCAVHAVNNLLGRAVYSASVCAWRRAGGERELGGAAGAPSPFFFFLLLAALPTGSSAAGWHSPPCRRLYTVQEGSLAAVALRCFSCVASRRPSALSRFFLSVFGRPSCGLPPTLLPSMCLAGALQDFDALCEEMSPSRWGNPHRYVPASAKLGRLDSTPCKDGLTVGCCLALPHFPVCGLNSA